MKKKNKTYLVTGAGSGFGKGIVLKMAKNKERVIAGVENSEQKSDLEREVKDKNLDIQIEILDITFPDDRKRAGSWDVDVLLNNAGVSLGGSLVDIPEEILRRQFEVNYFGSIFLTQEVVKQMVPKGEGKVVFVTSVHGIMADPISGPYCGTKFALEAAAESLSAELQQYGIEVAVINPGPYLTGFNDREYESFKYWDSDPSTWLYYYNKMAFPYEQIKSIDAVVDGTIDVMTGKNNDFRNVIPKALSVVAKKRQKDLWNKKSDEDLGKRHSLIETSFDIEPKTSILEGIGRRITKPFRKSTD